jgi:hypothetical protein
MTVQVIVRYHQHEDAVRTEDASTDWERRGGLDRWIFRFKDSIYTGIDVLNEHDRISRLE